MVRWTSTIVAIPILLVTSYMLYDRSTFPQTMVFELCDEKQRSLMDILSFFLNSFPR